MKFEYDGVEYDLIDPDHWTTLEAVRLQEFSGRKPHELVMDFREFGALGLHALAWVSLRRAGFAVGWDELAMPYFQTLAAMNGSPLREPEDPSTASTPRRKTVQGGRVSSARSAKK